MPKAPIGFRSTAWNFIKALASVAGLAIPWLLPKPWALYIGGFIVYMIATTWVEKQLAKVRQITESTVKIEQHLAGAVSELSDIECGLREASEAHGKVLDQITGQLKHIDVKLLAILDELHAQAGGGTEANRSAHGLGTSLR